MKAIKNDSQKVLSNFIKVKSLVIIPTGIKALDYNIDLHTMPKTTVGVGLELNKTFSFSYEKFDLFIKNGEVVILLTRHGQRNIKVNQNKNPNYFNSFFENMVNAIKTYLIRLNK